MDDDGQEHEFEILDIIENDDGCFYALLPTFEDPQDQVESDGTYYIFQGLMRTVSSSWPRWRTTILSIALLLSFESAFDEMFEARS